MINKSEEKSKSEEAKVATEDAHHATVLELEQLASYKGELHSSCDFVMKNFEIRQTARMEEMEALKQAKAILSGAKFDAFLQAQDPDGLMLQAPALVQISSRQAPE